MKIKAWTENWHDDRIENTCIRNRILLCYWLAEQIMTGEAV